MGETASKLLESNPTSTADASSTPDMTSSIPSETAQPETEPVRPPQTPESKSPILETEEIPAEKEAISEKLSEDSIEEEDGEEEGECGFCLFMKAGGCRDTFTDWEKCVEESEKKDEDIAEKCFQVTAALKKCMEAHSDYYAPLLAAEKAAEEEAAKQLEEESKKEMSNNAGDELGKKYKDEISDEYEKREAA